VSDLCRNRGQLGTTGDTTLGRKPTNGNAHVVWCCLLYLPLFELRILSRKGRGFDSRRSHARVTRSPAPPKTSENRAPPSNPL
jgi:hypothetical protein